MGQPDAAASATLLDPTSRWYEQPCIDCGARDLDFFEGAVTCPKGHRVERARVEAALERAQETSGAISAVSVESQASGDLPTLITLTTQSKRADIPWPKPLADEALYGLTGDVVRTIAPCTEADPTAILAHFVSGAGVLLGRETYMVVGEAQHPARLNALVIGATSKGRKGTAQRATERVLLSAAPLFSQNMVEGLSSGEGLIWQVRDPITKWEKVSKGSADYEEVVADPGVEDKRLWVVESEFATTLRVMQRDGNTLTAIVRRAWDRDDLATLTKNSPARATGAHIGITGHVSREELLRYLDRSELANGFANRFLMFAARRSRLLPEGDSVPVEALRPLAARLLAAREWAASSRAVGRDDEATAIWRDVYAHLSRDRTGLFGLVTNRAEAQVVRLSVLYAALDRSGVIRAEHLRAALAVWDYCEQSARWAFGDATGDPTADTVLSALRQGGELDRQAIYELLGRHANRSRIDGALGLLLTAGLARMRREPTGGRPREVWGAV